MKWTSFAFQLIVLLVGLSSSCLAEDPIKLHFIMHSHMDEGWLWSFEEYYQGTIGRDGNIDQSGGCVKCILNNVYQSLLKNPERKYQMAETAFFQRWWSDQTADVKANVKKMIQQNQFQFVNGGWSANDEACTYYEDIIENFITGHRWISNEFGLDPNVGWQIDSFGHSSTHAALMAQAGYDGIFFGRIDYRDWEQRRANQALEINWKPQNPHNESITGHVLYVDYSNAKFLVPNGYVCRSIFCQGRLRDWQYQRFKEEIALRSQSYQTKNVIMLIGDDFHLWKTAEVDFDGVEDLIQRLSKDSKANIQAKFSTISEYVHDMAQDHVQNKSVELPLKNGDFFPYIQDEWTSWVGYYTSKSMFKLKVREMSQYYNAAKLLLSKFLLWDSRTHSQIDSALRSMEESLSMVQHHDAITGTMREKVKADYERMLDQSKRMVEKEVLHFLKDYAYSFLEEKPLFVEGLDFNWRQKDPMITKAFIGQSDKANILVTVFNPGETDTFLLKIKSPNSKYKVVDDQNNYLVVDIICNNSTEPRKKDQECTLYFVDEIPAFSIRTYILEPSALSKVVQGQELTQEQHIMIGNQVDLKIESNLQDFQYKLCNLTGSEQSACLEDTFSLNYEYYEGNVQSGPGQRIPSGVYIFVPKDSQKKDFSPIRSGKIFKGRHITIIQIEREGVRTDLKFVHHELERGIEIESYFKPVNPTTPGKEIVMMIRSKEVQNDDQTFFTDQNGYYMQARKLNHRDFQINSTDNIPVPSNYYPITSGFYIENPKTKMRMTVVTDRAQGATSLKPGEIEIMVHRQTVKDDGKGLAEGLQETDPEGGPLKVSTRHFLIFSSPEYDLRNQQRVRQYKLDTPPLYFLANVKSSSFLKPRSEFWPRFLKLESNVKLSIRSYHNQEYVVRLQNLNENESKIVQIYDEGTKASLLNKFSENDDLKLSSISELSLFTHKTKDTIQKNKLDKTQPDWKNANDGNNLSTIELQPMEIRTFKIVVKG